MNWEKIKREAAYLYQLMIGKGELSLETAVAAMVRNFSDLDDETALSMIVNASKPTCNEIMEEIERLDYHADHKRRLASAVCYVEVMLRDDPVGYFSDGRMFLVPGALEWNRVEYREPEMCGCSIQGYLRDEGLVPSDGSRAANERADARRGELCEALGVDSCGSTMCRDCRESWELDHEVRGPNLT